MNRTGSSKILIIQLYTHLKTVEMRSWAEINMGVASIAKSFGRTPVKIKSTMGSQWTAVRGKKIGHQKFRTHGFGGQPFFRWHLVCKFDIVKRDLLLKFLSLFMIYTMHKFCQLAILSNDFICMKYFVLSYSICMLSILSNVLLLPPIAFENILNLIKFSRGKTIIYDLCAYGCSFVQVVKKNMYISYTHSKKYMNTFHSVSSW